MGQYVFPIVVHIPTRKESLNHLNHCNPTVGPYKSHDFVHLQPQIWDSLGFFNFCTFYSFLYTLMICSFPLLAQDHRTLIALPHNFIIATVQKRPIVSSLCSALLSKKHQRQIPTTKTSMTPLSSSIPLDLAVRGCTVGYDHAA